ncbi:TPA: hypothetical protein P2R03_004081 [Aeromonas veronii]|nr:hypothetical protein [Aeromonas veronii]
MSNLQLESETYDYISGLGTTEERVLCEQVVRFLFDDRSRKLRHISLGLLKAELDKKVIPNDKMLFDVVMHISSGAIRLLEMKFKLVDMEKDTEYLLTHDEIHESMKCNVLYHPNTGVEVPNFKDKVVVYFEASHILKAFHEH